MDFYRVKICHLITDCKVGAKNHCLFMFSLLKQKYLFLALYLQKLSSSCSSNLFRKFPDSKWIEFQKYSVSKFFGTEKILFFSQLKKNKNNLHALGFSTFWPSLILSHWPGRSLNSTITSKPKTASPLRAGHTIFICENISVLRLPSPLGPSSSLMCKCSSKSPSGTEDSNVGLYYPEGSGGRVFGPGCCLSYSYLLLPVAPQVSPKHWSGSTCYPTRGCGG